MSYNISEFVNYKLECKMNPSIKNDPDFGKEYSDETFYIIFKKDEEEEYLPVISGTSSEYGEFEHSDYSFTTVINHLIFGDWVIISKERVR